MKITLPAFALSLLSAVAASAQSLPPVPRVLLDSAAVVCLKVAGNGRVDGAFLVTSTGAVERDRELLGWVRQMRWNGAAPGEGERAPEGRWFPMPVAFGEAETPPPPAQCGPQGGASSAVA
jgi:TonB family protein